jgi:hypothetical protein
MDDFGNDYRDDAWAYGCAEYGHSMATWGWLDDVAVDICIGYGVDYAKQEV